MTGFRGPTRTAAYIPALALGTTGLALAYFILAHSSPEKRTDWYPLVFCSGAAAFVTSFLCWRILCSSNELISARRGALVGILTGVFAHPVAWYLTIVWNYMTGNRSSLSDRPANPIEGLGACFVFAAFSLFLTGWLTAPAGGIVGWVLGKVLRPRQVR